MLQAWLDAGRPGSDGRWLDGTPTNAEMRRRHGPKTNGMTVVVLPDHVVERLPRNRRWMRWSVYLAGIVVLAGILGGRHGLGATRPRTQPDRRAWRRR